MPDLTIRPLPSLRDNYIWLISLGRRAVVVDPGEAEPVLHALRDNGLQLAAILLTHHHADHTGGVPALTASAPHVPVFGPHTLSAVTHPVDDHARFVPAIGFPAYEAMATPGHTLDHLCYYTPGWLFAGDTLFAGGCGRLFEGTATQMLASLDRLATLPDDTRIACAHEYTEANLAFANAVEPGNPDITARQQRIRRVRQDGKPSLPALLSEERLTNPFLRIRQPVVRQAVIRHAGPPPVADDVGLFAALRNWKNNFPSA